MGTGRCGAKTKKGTRCERPAGWGTDHPGRGRCTDHPAPPRGAAKVATPPTPKNARVTDPKPSRSKTRQGKRGVPDWAPEFLKAFGKSHLVTEAAEVAGINRSTAYDRRAKDPVFAEAWVEIEERSTELLEREAYRRAAVGVDKPVFQGGKQVGKVREYSDTLLIFLLKARRPDTYRERVEHTGRGGGPLEHRVKLDLTKLSAEQLDALEAIQPDAGSADTG